jgi:hypothetical protein
MPQASARVWAALREALEQRETYLITSVGVGWSYRFQGEFYIQGTPRFAGFGVEAKTLRQGGLSSPPGILVFGIRY